METASQKKWLRFGLLGVLLALMVLVLTSDWGALLTLNALAQNRVALASFVDGHFVQAILLFMAIYAGAVALSVPGGAVLTMAGGFLFGVWLGGALTLVAATFGAVLLFAIAKTSLGENLAARASGSIEKLRQGFNKNAFSYLLFLRLVPLFPFWLVNLAPALLGVSLPVYVSATFIGIIPGTFAFAFFGNGLESILVRQQEIYMRCLAKTPHADCAQVPSIGDLLTPEIIIALCLLGLVALLPMLIQKIRGDSA